MWFIIVDALSSEIFSKKKYGISEWFRNDGITENSCEISSYILLSQRAC